MAEQDNRISVLLYVPDMKVALILLFLVAAVSAKPEDFDERPGGFVVAGGAVAEDAAFWDIDIHLAQDLAGANGQVQRGSDQAQVSAPSFAV